MDTNAVARGIRRRALELTLRTGECYLSQALSSAETLAALYTRILRLGPSVAPFTPEPFSGVPRPGHRQSGAGYHGAPAPNLDRLVVSAAHYAVGVYAALVETERLDPAALESFNRDGSILEMIGAEHSPGMEITSGSFGQALSQAAGMAAARRMRRESGMIWVFMSDGEFQEGQTWEAIQTMAHHKLDALGVMVDVNGQQVDGLTRDTMNIEPLTSRLEAFGAHVETVDGHDVEAISTAAAVAHPGKPLFVLCYTDPARGVPALEPRRPHLHFIRIKNDAERKQLERDLQALAEEKRHG